nr:hypothetical protein [Tanacetum cinerariifolium]
MSFPPSSPLSPLSSPPPQIPFSPLPLLLSPPLPVLSLAPPPSPIRKSSSATAARPTGGLRADYGFVATIDREIRCDPEREVGYRITDSWDKIVETLQGAPDSTDTELGGYMKEFETREIDYDFRDAEVIYFTVTCAFRSTNGDDSHNSGTGVRRAERVTRECTYSDFMKYKPLNFKGTKRVVKLTQWFEKIETVFRISNCSVENQIKFSTCTLLGSALTWWNSYVTTVGPDAAYAMTWVDMKKKMKDKYCPRGEMKKLENKIERYVGGLPDVIHGSVVASRPKTMQEAIEMANELIDKRNNSWAER